PSDEGVLETQPSGYLLHTSQLEEIGRHLELFSIKTEKISDQLIFVPMNQAMMTVIPPLFDERAPYNEINGLALYDFENPSSVTNMKKLVEYYDTEEVAFVDESDMSYLTTQSTPV